MASRESKLGVSEFKAKLCQPRDIKIGKVYAHEMYHEYLIEFDTKELHDDWYNKCKKTIEYAFYDCVACWDTKNEKDLQRLKDKNWLNNE